MDQRELEAWAITMAARNPHPCDSVTPVLLYRNGKLALFGGYVQMVDGTEVIFTAAHGFSIDYPPCVWAFRKLIPAGEPLRLVAKAAPMRNDDDDVALCTPASLLQLSCPPIPNFYRGFRRGMHPTLVLGQPLVGTVRSAVTGEDIRILGEAYIDGKLHVGLDVEAGEGQSGSVFINEDEKRMYVLRAYSPSLARMFRRILPQGPGALKYGVAFALRLAYE